MSQAHPEPDRRTQLGIEALSEAHRDLGVVLAGLREQLGPVRQQWDAATRASYERVQRQWEALTRTMEAVIQQLRHHG